MSDKERKHRKTRRPRTSFRVGDVVSAWSAVNADLVGVVIEVEDFTDAIGPNQKLTVKWFAPANTVEYAHDIEHSAIY